MSIVWPDYVDDTPWFEESAFDDEFSGRGGLRCGAISAWLHAYESRRHVLSKDAPVAERVVWPADQDLERLEASWDAPAESSVSRLWSVLATLQSAVGELDSETAPTGQAAEIVAHQLQDLVARLTRLEQALPGEALYEPQESKQEVVVDWRAINREQAKGLPTGILSEEGARLDGGPRIHVLDVSALEDEDEESLVE